MEEESKKNEINNLKNPIDSPENIFKSPNVRQQEDRMEELQKTILQMSKSNQEQNELFRTNH
jgi:hypothetical protein